VHGGKRVHECKCEATVNNMHFKASEFHRYRPRPELFRQPVQPSSSLPWCIQSCLQAKM